MKLFVSLLLTLMFYSDCTGQCYNGFSELPLQPDLLSAYSVRKNENSPYSFYYISQIKALTGGKSSCVYSLWNGSSWHNLKDLTITNGSMGLISWGKRVLAFGRADGIENINAAGGKYIGFAEYKNGQWDTLRGGVFNTGDYPDYKAFATELGLYINVINNNTRACQLYLYDTAAGAFRHLMDYEYQFGSPVDIQAGKRRLLIGNVYKARNIQNPGYCVVEGDSVKLAHSYRLDHTYRYCLDGSSDKVFAIAIGFGNKFVTVFEADDSLLSYTNTIAFDNAFMAFKVKAGKLVCQNSYNYAEKFFVLCRDEIRWTPDYLTGYKGANLSNLNVSENGFFIFDTQSQKVLGLGEGAQISGRAYIDKNQDCRFDTLSDIPVKNAAVRVVGNRFQSFVFTDASGVFRISVPIGNISVNGPGNLSSCAGTPNLLARPDSSYVADLPIRIPEDYNVSVRLQDIRLVRKGSRYMIRAELINSGLPCDSVGFGFMADPRLDILPAADPRITSVSGNTVKGLIRDLDYYESDFIFFNLQADTGKVETGDTVCYRFSAYPNAPDLDSGDNYSDVCSYVTYSFDPNRIDCDKSVIQTSDGEELVYEIAFQNEGNGDAEDVMLVDTLDNSLFLTDTAVILESSHPFDMVSRNNVMVFNFKGINLKPKSENEALSKGFIKFRVYSKAGLKSGDSIRNRAHIYFDLNAPIATNLSKVYIRDSGLLKVTRHTHAGFNVYPNPVTDYVQVQSDVSLSSASLWLSNMSGQSVACVIRAENNSANVDMTALPVGMYVLNIETATNCTRILVIKI